MDRNLGIVLVVVGGAIVLVGLLAMTGALGWFGRLPGDLRHEGERARVVVPVTSMIVVSVVLTVVVNVVLRLWR